LKADSLSYAELNWLCYARSQWTYDNLRLINDLSRLFRPEMIRVTEYAMAQWGPPQKTPDCAAQAKFASQSAKALEQLQFVERYALGSDRINLDVGS